MKKSVLRNYARLIAVEGGRIQKGQNVIIVAEIDQGDFVTMLVDECYKAGAREVRVEWQHQPLEKLHVRHQSVKTLGTVEKWEEEKLRWQVENLPVRIYLDSEDPDGLKGMNQAKAAKGRQARYQIVKPYRDQMEGRYQWCIAAVPGAAWAKKVFPHLSKHQAMEALWEAILSTCRAKEGMDAVAEWNAHNHELKARCAYLNSLGIETLEYHASNGTDFTVGMIPEARFCGGSEDTIGGVTFNPNMPTEEVFISPKRGVAEGIVYSSKPLSWQGELIENFSVRFHEGKAVEVHAEKNQALLEQMIAMDEGAAYLGECALVPVNSPISESGLIFWDTLFDENAACHLALGMGFTNTIRGFESKTIDECREMGINDSMEHNDFMIGYEGLDIDAVTRDGKVVPIFRRGRWAF